MSATAELLDGTKLHKDRQDIVIIIIIIIMLLLLISVGTKTTLHYYVSARFGK